MLLTMFSLLHIFSFFKVAYFHVYVLMYIIFSLVLLAKIIKINIHFGTKYENILVFCKVMYKIASDSVKGYCCHEYWANLKLKLDWYLHYVLIQSLFHSQYIKVLFLNNESIMYAIYLFD